VRSVIDSAICAVTSEVRKRAADHLARAGADRADEPRARAVQRGEHAEGDPRRQRDAEREEHDRQVERRVDDGLRLGLEHRADPLLRPQRDDEADDTPEGGEQHRLDEQLPDELAAPRA
jgi:hypothetical protein